MRRKSEKEDLEFNQIVKKKFDELEIIFKEAANQREKKNNTLIKIYMLG